MELSELIQALTPNPKQDSISVSKTSTGKYSFDIKLYAEDLKTEEKQTALITQIKFIHDELLRNFKNE